MEIYIEGSNISHTGLSQVISGITKEDPHFSYRTPSHIKQSLKRGYFSLALEIDSSGSENLAGFAEGPKIRENWRAVPSLYTFGPYRENGVARGLVKNLLSLYPQDIIYLPTLETRLAETLKKDFGFIELGLRDMVIRFPKPLLKYLQYRFCNWQIFQNYHKIFDPYHYLIFKPERSGIKKD